MKDDIKTKLARLIVISILHNDTGISIADLNEELDGISQQLKSEDLK